MNRYFGIVLVAWVVVLAIAQCKPGWDNVPPEAITPSKDYPCGIIGVPCLSDAGALNGTCCWQGETCGGNVGCPWGSCCDVRPFDPSVGGAQRDAGVDAGDGGRAGLSYYPFWEHVQHPPEGTTIVKTDAGAVSVRPLHPATPTK